MDNEGLNNNIYGSGNHRVSGDVQSTETFRSDDGQKMVVDILKDGSENLDILNSGFAVVAAAGTSNEVVRELFMELKIDEPILEALNRQSKGNKLLQQEQDSQWMQP
ncbi:hypothetical protein SADUNF_Sadunf09G0085800 [Salix dunnii]|uniref:Uncharacterized protein n=1 Tax=Salix dunnii TaxID=1413687 RepID=A0A835MWE1_9ROSI|nr:hypothetical protein SADUNF_Sadunf09G0085800 [Salix dunnii]